jgi:hypothetical protein
MFHHLTLAVRDRMIKELQEYWQDHPRYETLSKNIQGKYAFDERPQFGMIVKTGGASNSVLSPDNFIATVKGYVVLASVLGKKSVSIEWVREDSFIKPSKGVYHTKVSKSAGTDPYRYELTIDVYQYQKEDIPIFVNDTTIELLEEPVDKSFKLIENPSGRLLEDTEFSLDGTTVTLTEVVPRGLALKAQYTYKEPNVIGPIVVYPDQVYREVIPGCLIAIGRWIEDGDEQVIIVEKDRQATYHEYGGRWDISVDIDLVTRDVHSQADIADRTVVWLWSILRPKLSVLGLEMSDVSLGGEGEEVYDDNADDYFYTASMSLSIQADWFIHFPLVIPLLQHNLKGVVPIKDIIRSPVAGIGKDTDFIQRLL